MLRKVIINIYLNYKLTFLFNNLKLYLFFHWSKLDSITLFNSVSSYYYYYILYNNIKQLIAVEITLKITFAYTYLFYYFLRISNSFLNNHISNITNLINTVFIYSLYKSTLCIFLSNYENIN